MIEKDAGSPPKENSPNTALDKLIRLDSFVDEVRSGLERLTIENVKTIVLKFEELSIDTQDKLSVFADLIFEKAVNEPTYSAAVAEICKIMQFKKVSVDRGGEKEHEHVYFRKFLIGRCQKEFENEHIETLNGKVFMLDIAAATNENDKNRIRNEFEKREMQLKDRSMGVLRLICELYRLNMLTARIMHECIKKLLRTKDEESLERLCMLLTNIGTVLEEETSRRLLKGQGPQLGISDLSDYFKEMSRLVEKSKISIRVRSLMQDVIELRMRGWKKIVVDQGPSVNNNNDASETYSRGIIREESNGCEVEKIDEEIMNKVRDIAVHDQVDDFKHLLTSNNKKPCVGIYSSDTRSAAEVERTFCSKLSNHIEQQVSENPVSTGPVKMVTVRAKLSSSLSSQDKLKRSTAESEPLREKLRKKLVNHIECKAVKN